MNFQIHIHKEFKGHFGDGYFALMMDLPVVRKYISAEYCALLSKNRCDTTTDPDLPISLDKEQCGKPEGRAVGLVERLYEYTGLE